ncbi:MAG: NineTeen Complex (NTC) component [Alyxoria varia]|nr:MAG: NineTeen Complex (NTC) component [Alyxoria varia]
MRTNTNPPRAQARNSEKAQSMLFRFRASQAADLGIVDIGRSRRPRSTQSVTLTPEAEKWRGQVLKEISRKVTKIQDVSLSDYQIRDLNDEINKLMREKWAWERRIRDLGGPNYSRGGGVSVTDEQGREVPGGGKGYRYFGRARELPGVKEMFEGAVERAREEREAAQGGRRPNELARKGAQVDAGYFGWNWDEVEDGGRLLEYERMREKEAWERMVREPDEVDVDDDEHGKGGAGKGKRKTRDADEEWMELPGDSGDGVGWRVPTVEEVQAELVDRRRRKLLDVIGE